MTYSITCKILWESYSSIIGKKNWQRYVAKSPLLTLLNCRKIRTLFGFIVETINVLVLKGLSSLNLTSFFVCTYSSSFHISIKINTFHEYFVLSFFNMAWRFWRPSWCLRHFSARNLFFEQQHKSWQRFCKKTSEHFHCSSIYLNK